MHLQRFPPIACVLSAASSDLQSKKSIDEEFANALNSLCAACPERSEDFIREQRQVVRPGRSVGGKFANALNSLCAACPEHSEDFIREQRQTVRPGRAMSSINFGLKRRSNEAN